MMSGVMELTAESFEEQVLKSSKPFLVDFWAGWCGPCRAVSPIVEEIASDMADTCSVGKLNIDEHGEIAQRYGVMSIPTLVLFQDGKATTVSIGAASKEELLARIEPQLQSQSEV
jgi:thioredoxin 1